MRQIGILPDETQAIRLAAYLYTLGIRSQVDPEPNGIAIWAIDEDRISQARDEFAKFIQEPENERYVAAGETALKLQEDAKRVDEMRRRNFIPLNRRFNRTNFKSLTFVLIVICCAVGFATDFGENVTSPVYINLLFDEPKVEDGALRFVVDRFSADWAVFRGQIWRLVTPIFLHGFPLHLVMNMLGLHSLGKLVEMRYGWRRLLWLVLVIAIVSNTTQYALSGPGFVGISGVVFGLFGYAWIKSKFDLTAGYRFSPQSVSAMFFWMIACLTGLMGHIANGAHIAGFATGAVIAYASTYLPHRLGR